MSNLHNIFFYLGNNSYKDTWEKWENMQFKI